MLTVLNAAANHGILMFILRKVISDLNADSGMNTYHDFFMVVNLVVVYPPEFIEALFALVASLLVTHTGGNMIISGGIIPILVQILQNNHEHHARVVVRCLGILDNILYGFGHSFALFLEANGLEGVIERIKVSHLASVRALTLPADRVEQLSPSGFTGVDGAGSHFTKVTNGYVSAVKCGLSDEYSSLRIDSIRACFLAEGTTKISLAHNAILRSDRSCSQSDRGTTARLFT